MNSVFIKLESDIGDELCINMDKIVLIHRPSRTVCLDMVDGSDNGVISLSKDSIDKLVDNILFFKPANTIHVRTRYL